MRAITSLLLVALASSARAEQPYRATVSVVVDFSRSMAAASGDKALLSVALAGVREAVEAAPRGPGLESMILAFGGGKGSDACGATRTLLPPGVSPGPVLDALTPKAGGPRPLAAGLEAAAAGLGLAAQKAIVLVTSGADECGRDVCEAVRELREAQGLGRIDVVLVGGAAGAKARLSCLGPVREAKDAKELAKAVGAAMEAAFIPAELTVTAAGKQGPVAATVEVFAAGDRIASVRTATGTPLRVPAGRYHVRVVSTEGEHEGWRRDVEVAPDSKIALRVAVAGAAAELLARVRLNGTDAPEGTRVFVHRPGDASEEVASGWPGEPFRVPPGTWDVRAEIPGGALGNLVVWRPEVRLKPGAQVEVTVDAAQKQGSLLLTLVTGGEPAEEAFAMLLPNRSRAEDGPSLIQDVEATLPVGTYTVAARLETPAGPLLAWRDDVKIVEGRHTEVTLDVGPTGVITVDVVGRSEQHAISVAVSRPKELVPIGWLDAFVPARLPAGTWDLHVQQRFPFPKTWWQKGVTVVAGETRVVLAKPPGE